MNFKEFYLYERVLYEPDNFKRNDNENYTFTVNDYNDNKPFEITFDIHTVDDDIYDFIPQLKDIKDINIKTGQNGNAVEWSFFESDNNSHLKYSTFSNRGASTALKVLNGVFYSIKDYINTSPNKIDYIFYEAEQDSENGINKRERTYRTMFNMYSNSFKGWSGKPKFMDLDAYTLVINTNQ